MKLRRLRTFTLWTGTLLCVLIAAAFVVSAWWFVAGQAGGVFVYVWCGGIVLGLDEWLTAPFVVDGHQGGLFRWNYWRLGKRHVELPLYALFMAVAVPTLLVWRFVPKFPPGHCRRCGYNLKGLTEARCPECGAEFGRDTFEAERCR